MKNTGKYEGRETQWYLDRIEYLSEFVTGRRADTLREKIEQRTRYITICAENTFHPQNASALVRSAEAFGVQDIHTVETLCKFRPNVNIVRGSDKWVNIRRHGSTAEALRVLKSGGYRIVATMPGKNARTPLDFDVGAGKIALLFGTEHAGVSREVVRASDEMIQIPMCGMVESLNVSASAAILLYNLTARIRESSSIDWQLAEDEKAEVLFLWLMATIKDGEGVLERYGAQL